jgi:glycerol uptake facilitator-like aquaporin
MNIPSVLRPLAAEFLGASLLVTVVVGSGIAASELSANVGLQLLANSTATALGLAVLILLFGPVSGAHFNPVISVMDSVIGRRSRSGLSPWMAASYVAVQIAGGVGGSVLANAMFEVPTVLSTTERVSAGSLLGEVVATAGLVMLVIGLARAGARRAAAPAIGAYIGAAYWFTSSTSFANPAVTVGRIFTDTFAGIALTSALPFIAAQVVGGAIGALMGIALFSPAPSTADNVVVAQTIP